MNACILSKMAKKLDRIISAEKTGILSAKIIRPLSLFHIFIKHNKSRDNKVLYKKGLVLCHGHNHTNELVSQIDDIHYWYYVDNTLSVWPDYVADISDESAMAYFPNNYFDCILSLHCPVKNITNDGDRLQYPIILKNVHRMLKYNGRLVLTELPYLFYWFIPDTYLEIIIKKIHTIISDKDFESFKKDLLEIEPNCTDKDVYFDLMVGNYTGTNYEILNRMLTKHSIRVSKSFLLENGYKFENKSANFLTAKKLKNNDSIN